MECAPLWASAGAQSGHLPIGEAAPGLCALLQLSICAVVHGPLLQVSAICRTFIAGFFFFILPDTAALSRKHARQNEARQDIEKEDRNVGAILRVHLPLSVIFSLQNNRK